MQMSLKGKIEAGMNSLCCEWLENIGPSSPRLCRTCRRPKGIEKAIALVLKQAEALADYWTGKWKDWKRDASSKVCGETPQPLCRYRWLSMTMTRITSSTLSTAKMIFTQLSGNSPAIFPV